MKVNALALLALLILAPAVHAFEVPPNDGFVTDTASVLTADQEQVLEQDLLTYKTQTSNEIAVLIIDTLSGEPIADVAIEAGRKWGVGTSENDNGILIVIAHTDREIFIATGYGLEGAVPDIVAKGVIEEDILPEFRAGRYSEGITAGIEALKKHIGGEYTATRYSESSAGEFLGPVIFVIFLALQFFGAVMARTQSWWFGGVLGGVGGIILTILFTWWLSIPVLVALGLLIDFILSKSALRRRRARGGGFYGGFGGRGGHSGGFGGFGGGSFGGGGASGKW
jgi:uncharacterized protein